MTNTPPIELALEDAKANLPAFVAYRLTEIAYAQGYEEEKEEETTFTYRELFGAIDVSHDEIGKQITIWIASSDACQHSIHLGGSSVWINPDSHYIFFHPIPPTLLPKEPDQSSWWVIAWEGGITVNKITVRPPAQVDERFPDL